MVTRSRDDEINGDCRSPHRLPRKEPNIKFRSVRRLLAKAKNKAQNSTTDLEGKRSMLTSLNTASSATQKQCLTSTPALGMKTIGQANSTIPSRFMVVSTKASQDDPTCSPPDDTSKSGFIANQESQKNDETKPIPSKTLPQVNETQLLRDEVSKLKSKLRRKREEFRQKLKFAQSNRIAVAQRILDLEAELYSARREIKALTETNIALDIANKMMRDQISPSNKCS